MRIGILFCLLIINLYLSAQAPLNPIYNRLVTDTVQLPYGSAYKLKGNTLIVNFFISAGKRNFQLYEKQDLLAKQQQGISWLKKQAQNFGINLQFAVSNYGVEADVKFGEIKGGDNKERRLLNWIPTALEAIGYNNTLAFYDSINNLNKYDNIVVLLFLNKDGRSFAKPTNTNYKQYPSFLEGAVVYKQWNDTETSAATIIHELLHCFGAVDIYETKSEDNELLRKVGYIFKRSIMLQTHRSIEPLAIDQLNAWCLGWSSRYYGWYGFFINKNYHTYHVPPLKKF